MQTLTADQMQQQPRQLVDGALRGEPALVTRGGLPVFLTVPLANADNARSVRLELAAALFDSEQISVGLAARIAGMSHSEMIDELGRRDIATIRLDPGELGREGAAFGD